LRAANFKSVRGDFRFNHNQYPIQNYYLRVIGKDSQGRITNRLLSPVFTNHSDAYADACKMQ
jgi:branched-chain amino acid transport system substrate-binding protein